MARPLFRAFGIPVTIDPFFFVAEYFLYISAGGGRRGLYTALAVLVFVLIHEFGHALTAKAFGATAAVTLSFLAGFASYTAPRPLARWQSNVISVMGPATEFAAAIPLLYVTQRMFAGATTADQAQSAYDMYVAVAWAGMLLAVTNLVPLWPLDGGHIAESGLRKIFGPGAARPFAIASIVGAAALLIGGKLLGGGRGGYIDESLAAMQVGVYQSLPTAVWATIQATPAFLLQTFFIPLFVILGSVGRLSQLQRSEMPVDAVNIPSSREAAHEETVRAVRAAERASWTSGRPGEYPRGWSPSPWARAHAEMVAGRPDAATAALADLADDRSRKWLLDRTDRPEIGHLLERVPPSALDSLAVLEARVHHGPPEDLVAVATQRFIDERSAEPLYLGAAGLAERGLEDEAMQWLGRAVVVAPDPHRMSVDREFHRLHRRADFQQLLGEAQRAAHAGAP